MISVHTKVTVKLIPGVSSQRLTRGTSSEDRCSEAAFSALREEIRKRDHESCLGCGIPLHASEHSPSGGLDVHHLNANPHDNRKENLATLCALCHGVLHIGHFARRFGKGMRLIFCPELTQADLNLLTWVLGIVFCKTQGDCSEEEEEFKFTAEHVRERLLVRTTFPQDYFAREEHCHLFNQALSEKENIAFFATILGLLRDKNPLAYARREDWLGGLRVWYDPKQEQIFWDRSGGSLLERLVQNSAWQPGRHWVESWKIIARQFTEERSCTTN